MQTSMLFFKHRKEPEYPLSLRMQSGPPHCEIWYALHSAADINLGSQHKEDRHPVPTKRTPRDIIEEITGSVSFGQPSTNSEEKT